MRFRYGSMKTLFFLLMLIFIGFSGCQKPGVADTKTIPVASGSNRIEHAADHLSNTNYDEAVRLLEEEIKEPASKENAIMARVLLSRVKYKKYMFEKAYPGWDPSIEDKIDGEEELESASDLLKAYYGKMRKRLAFQIGIEYMERGKYEKGADYLEMSYEPGEITPKSTEARIYHAMCLGRLNRLEEMKEKLGRVEELLEDLYRRGVSPLTLADMYVVLGNTRHQTYQLQDEELRSGAYERAVMDFEKVLDMVPISAPGMESRVSLAEIYLEVGPHEKAVEQLLALADTLEKLIRQKNFDRQVCTEKFAMLIVMTEEEHNKRNIVPGGIPEVTSPGLQKTLEEAREALKNQDYDKVLKITRSLLSSNKK